MPLATGHRWRDGRGRCDATASERSWQPRMTAPLAILRETSRRVGGAMAEHDLAGGHDSTGAAYATRARVLGVHLEGPALSPVRSAGHDPTALVSPAMLAAELDSTTPSAWRSLRIVTLAPELDGGARPCSTPWPRRASSCPIGHTDATGRCRRGCLRRRGPIDDAPVQRHAAAASSRAPGPSAPRWRPRRSSSSSPMGSTWTSGCWRRSPGPSGRSACILVSDALALAGTRLRRVDDARVDGHRPPGWRRSIRTARSPAACSLLDGLVESAVRSGIPLASALRAATENPARLLGLPDRGPIEPGARADLVVVSHVRTAASVLGRAPSTDRRPGHPALLPGRR